jgi:SAM-dependent methyltransferase
MRLSADFSSLRAQHFTTKEHRQECLSRLRRSGFLRRRRFALDFLAVRNDAYNPDGRYLATAYALPYPDQSLDVVFLISVFTHMLTDEVRNYAKQIEPVLRPGGRSFLTAYLLDRDTAKQFGFRAQEHSYADESVPRIAVGYNSGFLSSTFAANCMPLSCGPLWGTVHGSLAQTALDHDLMVFTKRDWQFGRSNMYADSVAPSRVACGAASCAAVLLAP